jgi:hypothetical protein
MVMMLRCSSCPAAWASRKNRVLVSGSSWTSAIITLMATDRSITSSYAL